MPTFAPIPASTPTPQISVMILAVSISVGLLLVLSVCTTAIILSVFCGLKKTKQNNIILQFTDDSRKDIPEIKMYVYQAICMYVCVHALLGIEADTFYTSTFLYQLKIINYSCNLTTPI